MGHKIRKALLGNLWIKLLSLLIAIGIWFMVSNANDPVRTTLFPDVPITIVNQDSVAEIGKVIEVQRDRDAQGHGEKVCPGAFKPQRL